MSYRNYSPRTIQSYLISLTALSKYYQGQSPATLSTSQIKRYLYHCKAERGLSTSFVNQLISALKILKKDVLSEDLDKSFRIERPRRVRDLPVILSKSEVRSILSQVTNLKHKTILSLLYSSGIRIGELLSLRLSDIDSSRMKIRICLGKGFKSRDSILSVQALDLLRRYYLAYRPQEYVFEGGKGPGSHYSTTSVRKIIKTAASKAGINKSVSAHSFRHAFATHLLEDGVSLLIIQQFLGHRSLRSTTGYLHLGNLSSEVISPLDRS